jgi:predicted nucleotide-binding protein
MFNLIVSVDVGASGTARLRMEKLRFLENTSGAISNQLSTVSLDAIESLKSWPCLLMQEGRSDESSFLSKILSIETSGDDVLINTSEIVCLPTLNNKVLWGHRKTLGIDEFEFHRNHWSIKERDLVNCLTIAGYQPDARELAKIIPKPLPAPSRQQLLQAKALVGEWGHSAIDDFILEAGVTGLEASRNLGGRRDRANAILQFILCKSAAVTAENRLFSAFFVEKAGVLTHENSNKSHAVEVATPTVPLPVTPSNRSPNRVFVVHGRNEEMRSSVVSLLSRVGLEAIVLHEQPNMGRHLLTKFVDEAELVTFAVVVMTDDDVGGPTSGELRPRTRQNVILELGYFLSHLGQKRVCALVAPDLETPSDFDGIVYIKMGADARWERELIRELRAAEMPLRDP